jgi:hypothetical protein
MNQTFELDGGAGGVVVNDGGVWRWRRPARPIRPNPELLEILLALRELMPSRSDPIPADLLPVDYPPSPPFPAGCMPDDIIAGWEISREFWRNTLSYAARPEFRTMPHDEFYRWMNEYNIRERFPALSEIRDAVERAKRGKRPADDMTVSLIVGEVAKRKGVPMRTSGNGAQCTELTLPKDGCDDRLLTEAVVNAAKAMGGAARTKERSRPRGWVLFTIFADDRLLDALCRRAIDVAREQLGLPRLD